MEKSTGLVPQTVPQPAAAVHDGDHEAVISASAPVIERQLTCLRAVRDWITGAKKPLTDSDLIGCGGAIMVLGEIHNQLRASECLEAGS